MSRGAAQEVRRPQDQREGCSRRGTLPQDAVRRLSRPKHFSDKETGIGNWTTVDFVNAMKHGIGPGGEHLYPAFPYSSYQRMTYEDLIDLKAYLDTLPAVKNEVPPHELSFPFNIRRGLGLWQILYVDGKSFTPDAKANAELNRGAYLVMGPGHCAECHSSRNILGGIVQGTAFAGAKNPEGKGTVPNITPSDDGIGDWRPPRDGEHARFRCDRREYGSCTGEYGEDHTRGPQSHRCVYQVAAAPARRCPQVRTEKERGKDQRVRK